MSGKETGFITMTYKLRLYDRHQNWLVFTRQLYNQVVWHYYQILMEDLSLLKQSNFLLLRTLEECSIGTKKMQERGEEPLWKLKDMPKIPMYFRRAAINMAIGLARSYHSSYKLWQEKQKNGSPPSPAAAIDSSPVFYKGMYRAFQTDSIQLKVFNGEKWVWMTYPYTGREIPKEGKVLSPTLKLEKKTAYLHVPVKLPVEDIRTVKERMKQEERICAVAFPDTDSLAVCVIMGQAGEMVKHCFIHGGREREAQRKQVLERLEKSRKSRKSFGGTTFLVEGDLAEKDKGILVGNRQRENAVLYKKLEQINGYYAHKVSRAVLEYCKENQIKVIVVPNYENIVSFDGKYYLHTSPFRWQGRAMIRNLKYKGWREGILVTTIRPYHISDCCSECGKKIERYNEGHKASRNYYGGQLFFCPNGHQGNTALNTAKNIGRYFLRRFQEESEQEDFVLKN